MLMGRDKVRVVHVVRVVRTIRAVSVVPTRCDGGSCHNSTPHPAFLYYSYAPLHFCAVTYATRDLLRGVTKRYQPTI